jgi:hypothetical protein
VGSSFFADRREAAVEGLQDPRRPQQRPDLSIPPEAMRRRAAWWPTGRRRSGCTSPTPAGSARCQAVPARWASSTWARGRPSSALGIALGQGLAHEPVAIDYLQLNQVSKEFEVWLTNRRNL